MKFISLFALLFVLSSCSSEANMKSGSGSRKSRLNQTHQTLVHLRIKNRLPKMIALIQIKGLKSK